MIQVLKIVSLFLREFRKIPDMIFYSKVNDLQFSHWVEDVLAVVENLTDGPIVLVKLQRWAQNLANVPIVLVKSGLLLT